MHYITRIHRGMQFGKALNIAQRTSSLFAEEPVVLGKVFRRGYPPLVISQEQLERNKTHLMRLVKAGAITIEQRLSPEDEATLREEIAKKLSKQPEKVVVPELTGTDAPVVPPPEEVSEQPSETIKTEQAPQTEQVVVPVQTQEESVEVAKTKKGKNK